LEKGRRTVLRMAGKMRNFGAEMKKENISAYAASIAFFLFLSLVPMLVFVCSLMPYTPLTREILIGVITEITPDVMDPVMEKLVAEVYYKSAGVVSVALLATVWSAGKGILALMRGLNSINEVEEKRNYFVVRTVASFYTLLMLVVMILSLFIMVFGNRMVNLTLHRMPQLQGLASFLMNFRFVFIWAVLTVLFAMIYAYIPNAGLKFKEQITGAMFTAIGWSIFSWGFSLYVDRDGAFGVYGSLSIIVISMIWLYCCMYIVLVGAYLNRYFDKGRQDNYSSVGTDVPI